MSSPLILSRVPFRLPLGGGSTDLPSYYRKHGGFIFAAAIDLYMDVLIKQTRSDDLINVHYKSFEGVSAVEEVQHPFAREALKTTGLTKGISISFKADTPAGTGLGSSGACAVALLKGLSRYAGKEMSPRKAATEAFAITRRLGLPDGMQDPYVCAYGGFTVLRIGRDGIVRVERPHIARATIDEFFDRTPFTTRALSARARRFSRCRMRRKCLSLSTGRRL
jgi:D-glycero-alpha-D-manno-heptose-7-phosphate kinase